jgi:hypothetical protein
MNNGIGLGTVKNVTCERTRERRGGSLLPLKKGRKAFLEEVFPGYENGSIKFLKIEVRRMYLFNSDFFHYLLVWHDARNIFVDPNERF